VGPDSRLAAAEVAFRLFGKGTLMVAVERTSRYADLSCTICQERFKPGDLVLPSFRNGERRAIHAHVCKRAAAPAPKSGPVVIAAVA
jgi:hypothetical protein